VKTQPKTLTQTYQTRVILDDDQSALLKTMATVLSQVERSLFADLMQKKSINTLKSEYIKRFDITARHFNACRVLVEGKIRSIQALQKENFSNLNEQINHLEKKIQKISTSTKKSRLIDQKKKLANTIAKRNDLQQMIESDKVSLCFGTKKLFRAQFHLEKSGFSSHEEWKNAWNQKRNSEFFTLGSKDESGGNQTCTPFLAENGKIDLRIRLPNMLDSTSKHLWIRGIEFAYGQDELVAAIRENEIRNHLQKTGDIAFKELGKAISFRFLIEEKGVRIFAITDLSARAINSKLELGVIGVDINNDHLAISETDRFGNLVETKTIPLVLYGKSSNQSKALIGDACKQIVEFALERKKPMALEELDFQNKKRGLKENKVQYRRMLSSFAYNQIIKGIGSQAFKKGIEIGHVNPAYTSMLGQIKYSKKYGISVHHAAALCIARRMQKFSEKLPRQTKVPTRRGTHMNFSVPVRNQKKSQMSYHREVGKKLQAAHAEHFLETKRLSSSPGKEAFASNNPKIAGEIPARESLAELLG
jgi:IS605 OrfB family transposase